MTQLRPIGVIRTAFTQKDETPIQGAFHPENLGQVIVFDDFAEALRDIDGFTHLYLLYEFDRAAPVELVRQTFLGDVPHGLFATRHPARPNPIGLTVVPLIAREGTVLTVGSIDVLDGTPLLDIKPYVPRFDAVSDASEGWLAGAQERPKPPGRE